MSSIEALQEAYRLLKSDSRGETVLALLVVAIVVGPFVWQLHQARQNHR